MKSYESRRGRLSLGQYRSFAKLSITTFLLLAAALFWYESGRRDQVQIAVAKGQQIYASGSLPAAGVDANAARTITLADSQTAALLGGKRYDFVNAVRLSAGEAQVWQRQGCGLDNCVHVTLYDYSSGRTVNTIVNEDTEQVTDRWVDPAARPAGSSFVMAKAVAIAATDREVWAVLGDIGAGDPVMVPMSGWLADDDCRQEWCVDLTYHDPAGSGRVFHVFVNMEQEKVARTFYTRARPDLDVEEPVAQRDAFSDDCHEQYGWSVCWEMTAHDGVNFRDASYDGTPIFSSAKIGQIEAWYPSWPGGYRDEIGFNASVPPFGATEINDLGDGFEVRQLFTEFTRWPNCICCYRYEEIIRFYADGTLAFHFVSHGPGCDDLSVYRPFWRINLALDGPENDQVWVWQDNQWVEARREQEIGAFVENLSPDGYKVATLDGEVSYRWRMAPTDPLGLDEALFFVLQYDEMEGEGPVATGPGDTYQPPRQWIDGDAASGQDVVVWFVPLLKTKKGGPWWCMPDPEPGINQCEAILRLEPAGELRQPTTAELAQATPTTVPSPTSAATPEPTSTPRPIEGEDAEMIILNAGCSACHAIGNLGEGRKVGPDLSNIGAVAGSRVAGLTAEAYLRQSILAPDAFIAPECPNGPCIPNVMPGNYARRLTPAQVDTIVAFLLDQTGEPAEPIATIGAPPQQQPTAVPKAFPAPQKNNPAAATEAGLRVQLLLLCIVFLLSLFRLWKQPRST
ncbi:MAG TPA: hypothetical protein VF177_22700 [Anaerolineae bacterium]